MPTSQAMLLASRSRTPRSRRNRGGASSRGGSRSKTRAGRRASQPPAPARKEAQGARATQLYLDERSGLGPIEPSSTFPPAERRPPWRSLGQLERAGARVPPLDATGTLAAATGAIGSRLPSGGSSSAQAAFAPLLRSRESE